MEAIFKMLEVNFNTGILVLAILGIIYLFKLYVSLADRFNGVIEKIYPALVLLEDRLKTNDDTMREVIKTREELMKIIEWCKRRSGGN